MKFEILDGKSRTTGGRSATVGKARPSGLAAQPRRHLLRVLFDKVTQRGNPRP